MYRISETRRRTADEHDLKIGYVGGGSHGWAHTLINDLAQCDDLSGDVALYDIVYESAARNAVLGNEVIARKDTVGSWRFTAHREMSSALMDADFVVCSIQDTPEDTFVHDIDIPQEYGIYQTVADTVGPGGTMRALRSIPAYREIAAEVREHCPEAWVLTYTNPMTVCTQTLYKEYPDIKAIGLCHEAFKTQHLFSKLAEKYVSGAENVDPDDIAINLKGINHFTWVDEASWGRHDLFRYLDQELEARQPLPMFEPGDMYEESYWVNNERVAFDLYDKFGILGAAGDRHLAEFVPWYLSIDSPEEIHRWGIRLTPSSARTREADHGELQSYADSGKAFELHESGEEAVGIIRALLGRTPLVTHVNFPNIGQVNGLPTGAVVETNALLTADSIKPLSAGSLPASVSDMVQRHMTNQATLIEAGFEGDLALAFRAFLNDPLVSVPPDKAYELFTDLIDTEQEYLSTYDFESLDRIGSNAG